ncbi:MAG: hypothetical protein LBJ67_08750 [Planctomycetaceae bacterium]|jgi:hypothetical protein|nr:hypothetical protein [Planctomycetaceae bacterium]
MPFLFALSMPSDNSLTLTEVRRQLNEAIQRVVELRCIENQLLDEHLPTNEHTELALQFDDKTRTVSWLGRLHV